MRQLQHIFLIVEKKETHDKRLRGYHHTFFKYKNEKHNECSCKYEISGLSILYFGTINYVHQFYLHKFPWHCFNKAVFSCTYHIIQLQAF